MDQRLFILGRESALRELMPGDPAGIRTHIGYATTSMILGWATGGIIFGMMSDKIGRVKTMVATLLVYSGFTGLSGLANSWVDFTIYRFLAGIGIGGMFGAATTLVAESVPAGFRAMALGSLQALSALGNIIGSLLSLQIPPGSQNYFNDYAGWRVLFFVGIVPALLVIPIIFVLKEPESWLKAKADAAAGIGHKNVGSPAELFRDPRWRRNTIVGLFLGVSGMIGLWGIGFFSPELISTALRGAPQNVVDTVRGGARRSRMSDRSWA
jgi:MFS family permease